METGKSTQGCVPLGDARRGSRDQSSRLPRFPGPPGGLPGVCGDSSGAECESAPGPYSSAVRLCTLRSFRLCCQSFLPARSAAGARRLPLVVSPAPPASSASQASAPRISSHRSSSLLPALVRRVAAARSPPGCSSSLTSPPRPPGSRHDAGHRRKLAGRCSLQARLAGAAGRRTGPALMPDRRSIGPRRFDPPAGAAWAPQGPRVTPDRSAHSRRASARGRLRAIMLGAGNRST